MYIKIHKHSRNILKHLSPLDGRVWMVYLGRDKIVNWEIHWCAAKARHGPPGMGGIPQPGPPMPGGLSQLRKMTHPQSDGIQTWIQELMVNHHFPNDGCIRYIHCISKSSRQAPESRSSDGAHGGRAPHGLSMRFPHSTDDFPMISMEFGDFPWILPWFSPGFLMNCAGLMGISHGFPMSPLDPAGSRWGAPTAWAFQASPRDPVEPMGRGQLGHHLPTCQRPEATRGFKAKAVVLCKKNGSTCLHMSCLLVHLVICICCICCICIYI